MRLLRTLLALSLVAVAVPTSVAIARDQDDEAELLVEEAKRAIAKKSYQRAAELLDRALQTSPRRLDLYILRASVYGVNGKHDAAVALLEKARALAPDNAGVLTALGIQLVQAGRPAEGVPLLQRMVAADPARYDAQVVLGHELVRQREYAGAVKAFEAYFKHRPSGLGGEDSVHRLDQANAMLRNGDAKGALELYRKVLAADKTDEMARLGTAWATAALSCKSALPVLESVSDLETKYAEVSLVRGRCALLLGRIDDALARADRYRTAQPEATAGWILYGDVRSKQEKWQDAEAAFLKVAEKTKGDPLVMLKLAHTERMLGKYQKASERLRDAGPPRTREDEWTVEYGETLLALKQATGLKDLIGPWIKTHEGHAQGELLIGSAFYLQGANDEAVPHLELSVKAGEARAKPVLVDALNTLAADAVKKSDLAGAKARLEGALAAGGSPLTTRNLGAVLVAQNEFDRAITVLKPAADDPTALHLLARAYQGAKKFDDARAAYNKAAKTLGKDPRAVTVLRDLANEEIAAGRGEEAMGVLDQAVALAPAASKKEIEVARVNVARMAATEAMRAGRYAAAVKLLRAVEKSVDGQALTELRCDLALAATGATQRDLALELLRGLERSKAKCAFAAPADDVGVPILIAWNEDTSRAKPALDRLELLRRRATGVAEPLLRQAGGDIALRAAADAYNKGNVKGAAAFLNIARNYDRRSPELAHNQAVIDLLGGKVDDAITALTAVSGEVAEARINLGIAYEKKNEPQKALAAWKAALSANARWGPLKEWIEAKERFWGAQ